MEDILKIPTLKGKGKRALLMMLRPYINNPTETEVDILSEMLEYKIYTLNKNNRVVIRTKLDINKFTFNNYLKRLKDKGLVLFDKTDNLLKLNPSIISLTKDNILKVEIHESA